MITVWMSTPCTATRNSCNVVHAWSYLSGAASPKVAPSGLSSDASAFPVPLLESHFRLPPCGIRPLGAMPSLLRTFHISSSTPSLPQASQLRLPRNLRPRHPRALKPKQIRPHLPHLHLLAPLRDPIPPEMPPYVLKRLVPTIPVPAMHLDRPVRRLRTQPVRVVITHSNLMAELALDGDPGGLARRFAARSHGIHLGGGAQDQ